jgi:hypothetical protein
MHMAVPATLGTAVSCTNTRAAIDGNNGDTTTPGNFMTITATYTLGGFFHPGKSIDHWESDFRHGNGAAEMSRRRSGFIANDTRATTELEAAVVLPVPTLMLLGGLELGLIIRRGVDRALCIDRCRCLHDRGATAAIRGRSGDNLDGWCADQREGRYGDHEFFHLQRRHGRLLHDRENHIDPMDGGPSTRSTPKPKL